MKDMKKKWKARYPFMYFMFLLSKFLLSFSVVNFVYPV